LDSILACPEGLEPPTPSLEGWCSIQLSYGQRALQGMVGAAGFELATYWSQTSCATRLRYAPNERDCTSRVGETAGQRDSSTGVGAGSSSWREIATHCWMCSSHT
jgi:hypothetical protein